MDLKMDLSTENWLAGNAAALIEAAEHAFGLKEFVRMSGNQFGAFGRETTFWIELEIACGQFKSELIKRDLWEDFADSLGMDA